MVYPIQCAVPSESKVSELHKMIEDKYAAANGAYVVSIAILDRWLLILFFYTTFFLLLSVLLPPAPARCLLKKESSHTRFRCAPKVQQHISARYALLRNILMLLFLHHHHHHHPFPLPYVLAGRSLSNPLPTETVTIKIQASAAAWFSGTLTRWWQAATKVNCRKVCPPIGWCLPCATPHVASVARLPEFLHADRELLH